MNPILEIGGSPLQEIYAHLEWDRPAQANLSMSSLYKSEMPLLAAGFGPAEAPVPRYIAASGAGRHQENQL
eukprot:648512-Pyramimonas_sp.AAC.1